MMKVRVFFALFFISITLFAFNTFIYAKENIHKSIYYDSKFESVADAAVKNNRAYLVGKNGLVVLDISGLNPPKTIEILK